MQKKDIDQMGKKNVASEPNVILKEQRLKRSWTQGQLAEKLGTTIMNVSRWERGLISPGLHFQQKLCDLFQLSPQQLGLQVNDNSQIDKQRQKIIDPALPLTLKNAQDSIGRDDLLEKLIQLIISGVPNIALTGLPGVGKTTVAVLLASHPTIQEAFPDGVLWVGLGRQPQIIALLSRWGLLLEMTPEEMSELTTIDAWRQHLRDSIGSRRLLLILDDAWKTEDTLPFHLNGHECTHILTTRFPTIAHTFASHHVYNVPEFTREECLTLLQQFIPHIYEAFPGEIDEIIQRIGGLPLAITLIGRHLLAHNHTGQLRRVHEHLLHLIENVNERVSLQQYPMLWERATDISHTSSHSLQATITMSYDDLSDQAQSALRAMTIFPPKPQSFSEQSVLSICQINTKTLDEIVDSGLLTYTAPDRYQLHQTISDVLQLLPRDPDVNQRFQNYFISYLNQHQHDLEKVEQELPLITTALEMVTNETTTAVFLSQIQTILPFLHARSLYTLAQSLFTRLQTMAEQQKDHEHLNHSLFYFGLLNEWQGNLVQAAEYYANGLFNVKELDLQRLEIQFKVAHANVQAELGNFSIVEKTLHEGLDLAYNLEDTHWICWTARCLGKTLTHLGRIQEAQRQYQQVLPIAYEAQNWDEVSALLLELGIIMRLSEDFSRAHNLFQESLLYARRLKHLQRQSMILVNLGLLSYFEGDLPTALTHTQESLAFAQQTGNRICMGTAVQALGMIECACGNYQKAEACFHESLMYAQEIGHQWLICETMIEWAALTIHQRQYSKAEHFLSLAIPQAQSMHAQHLLVRAHFIHTQLSKRQNKMQQAFGEEEETNKIFQTIDKFHQREINRWLEKHEIATA